MKYLLDTNVVSELRKVGDGKADANVAKWVGAQDSNVLFISAITILEIEHGILSNVATPPRALACEDGWIVVFVLNSPSEFCQSMTR